jgi:IS605 OrfB family transposase
LIRTIEIFSSVYAYVNEVGSKERTYNKTKLHHLTYSDVRKQWPELPSALVQTARDVASEALKRLNYRQCEHKKYSSMRLNQRCLRADLKHKFVTISSIEGRLRFNIKMDSQTNKYKDWSTKSATMSYRNGVLILNLIMESPTPEPVKPTRILGIDRGINNIAVCSNNQFFNSSHLRNVKSRYQYNRAVIQSKGTRKARLKLRRLSGRETRFVRDVNHCLSKALVNSEYDTFALENLKNIPRSGKGRVLNRKLGNWSFHQLQNFLAYKAEAVGKNIVLVNPRNTSRKCSKCGHTEKTNRSGPSFHCKKCGFQLDADLNASRNIANLGISLIGRVPSTTQMVPSTTHNGQTKPTNSLVGS